MYQDPPRLGNQWQEDRALRALLRRSVAPDALAARLQAEPALAAWRPGRTQRR